MNDLVWLASYPKSGNTWFRLLIETSLAAPGAALDINDLQTRGGIASSRRPIDELSLLDSHLLTHREADWLRPGVHEALARGEFPEIGLQWALPAMSPRLMKIHDAYTAGPDGAPLFAVASAAVVIVRDPRSVAPSLASFFNHSIDQSIADMASDDFALSARITGDSTQVRQTLLSWSAHIRSWLDQTDVPVHLVRYEDLKADTVTTFQAAMRFAGHEMERGVVEQAVAATDFAHLQAQERERGFLESKPNRKHNRPFFRQGRVDGWREELSADQVARIEADHGEVMRRLGYALSSEPVSRLSHSIDTRRAGAQR